MNRKRACNITFFRKVMDKPLLCASDRSRIHGLGAHGASGKYKKKCLHKSYIVSVGSDVNFNCLIFYSKESCWPNSLYYNGYKKKRIPRKNITKVTKLNVYGNHNRIRDYRPIDGIWCN